MIMKKIAIIHPSRGRAKKSKLAVNSWFQRAVSITPEIKVSVDSDDPELELYKEYYGGDLIINKNRSAVDAINNAAKLSGGDIFIVLSDDTECPPGWAMDLLHITSGKSDFILKTQDGIQPWIITMPILDRAYYNRFGYIYQPDFTHMFCDTFLTCVADLTGRKITSDLLFPHKHYSVTKEKPDAVNRRADATWKQGEDTFIRLARQNYLLIPEEVKGTITDPGYLNWIKQRL